MNRAKKHRIEREMNYQFGWINACHTLMMLCLVVGIAINACKVAIGLVLLCAVLACMSPLRVKGTVMLKYAGKLLGLGVIGMKLDAVARHLKVKFKHVPERYECEPATEE